MTTEELAKDLIKYDRETGWLMFRANWFEPEELGYYISSLSNGAAFEGRKHAYFIWGVTDCLAGGVREITGTSFDFNCHAGDLQLIQYLSANLFPEVEFAFDEVYVDGKRIVLLTVQAAKIVPVAFNHIRYVRTESGVEDLFDYPDKECALFDVLRNGLATMVNTESEYQDLTFEKLLVYYSSKGIELNRNTFKQNLSFYTEDGKCNILAQVLSDNSHIPVKIAFHAGTDRTDMVYFEAEIGMTCLVYTLDDALRYGRIINIPQADERNRIVERIDVPLFDADAFREAVINAFVHNNWTDCNPPEINVFFDRIEILSHGSLSPDLSADKFEGGISVPVNPELAGIFRQLGISGNSGRGVGIIIKKCGKEAYEFLDNAIRVTLRFNRINTTEGKPANRSSKGPALGKPSLNDTQAKILSEIRKNPKVTQAQLEKLVGVAGTAIYNNLAKLKQLGYVERVGSKRGGFWKALK